MHIKLANPRGFCAGVDRAIEIVNRALEVFGPPIYVRHEVVHNKFVVEDLRSRGAIFVEELDQVPDDVIVIFSAHGVSQAVRTEASGRGLKVFDATCPLVTKVHIEVARYSRDGRECILIGHAGHPEVEGTMGQYDASNGGAIYLVEDEKDVANLHVINPEKLAFVTQTTLSMDDTSRVIDALRSRFPAIGGPRKDRLDRGKAVHQLQADLLGAPRNATTAPTIKVSNTTIGAALRPICSIWCGVKPNLLLIAGSISTSSATSVPMSSPGIGNAAAPRKGVPVCPDRRAGCRRNPACRGSGHCCVGSTVD